MKTNQVLARNPEVQFAEEDDALIMRVALNLKRARLKADLSQREASAVIGCTPNTLSCWEIGRNQASVASIYRLLRLYRITFEQLVTGEGLPDLDDAFQQAPTKPVAVMTPKPKAREHSDDCDTLEPSLMCPECLELLRPNKRADRKESARTMRKL